MFRNYRIKNFNFFLMICVFVLTIIGIAVVGSAEASYQNRQIIGMLLGIIAMVITAIIDYDFILQFYRLWYVGAIVLLLSVFTPLGHSVAGATRWIDLGIRFQPSEMAKVLLVLFFAHYLSKNYERVNEPWFLIRFGILAGIPLVLIVSEPDLSTTIVTFLIIASMLFCAGLSYKVVTWALGLGIVGVSGILIFLINGSSFLKGYQNKRIMAWLYPDEYPQDSYQQQNSIMAIGSGQFWGKGLNNDSIDSVKNGNYIAEPQTDFIFAVAAEELGFVGSVAIIILLVAISILCIRTSKKARNLAGQLICIGMASIVGYQSFVNICVVTGLLPNTGLTLPFISYGLTSLVTLYAGMGFVLNVSLQPKKVYL